MLFYCHFGQATLYVGELLNSGKWILLALLLQGLIIGLNMPFIEQ